MAIHLPLCDIPVRIAPNARTTSNSPLAHLTPPHPPSSDVLVREDREKKSGDYESLTIVHQVTEKERKSVVAFRLLPYHPFFQYLPLHHARQDLVSFNIDRHLPTGVSLVR